MIVEIATHGSSLKRDHDCFVIHNNQEKTEIPAEKVDAIMISANIMLTTQVINLCLEKNVQLVLTDRSGKPTARLWSSTQGRATEIRRSQYINMDTHIGLEISRNIAMIKLQRQKRFLMDLKNNRKQLVYDILQAIETIELIIKRIKQLLAVSNIKATLLGLEGVCGAKYFRAISSALPKKWAFKERSQHPALDGFNAALNYMYGIGYSTVEKIIILSGLDPHAGFSHADSYGKPTLSFDIIEIVRPMMDRTVVTLFTKRRARERWFEKQDDGNSGIFLTREARQVLISSFVYNNKKKIELECWNYCRSIIQKLTAGGN